ncbi:2-keto-4-pentenoate hydratase/2-oxohepta-3-ene-1,7-dioic acid hydratase (catechol pathway) [Sporobacter termitidis DSM 10068]|uniref:2-keto-4-pentenoate hydratase/2-oxohepta-3-ene-1,7-dioic acid hydratase (Catechol pathway) n=1 Tax=Sporobacter termitidis DSM 10068 TaxID=1123282 RepID=A0A1M5Y7J2_9FIRM|nr:fumarylacetoacetate hydrolase family protein [Sporobacter termitidis]SHI07778.1 2-keto-4-pentenoate hydratase/2-oxohepta-3-ene-1,7-dioic acid hydratase (catechol pathway) [Sporobacter termitidis DSM 10068]
MKLLTFIKDGKTRVGALTDRGVADLTALGLPDNMNDIIAGGDAMKKRIGGALMDGKLAVLDFSALEFANITVPQKIVCVGLNYKSHAEETGGTAPKDIVFFSKFNDALTPAGKSVTLPPWQRCYDYEAELVVVIGKEAWNVPRESALDYVFGYTCGNDLSARDSQFLSGQWLAGKAFPGFGPAGPVIVTADSFDPDADNGVYCAVNGVQVQSGVTSDMIFSCAEIVSTASRFFRLGPGDLIFTGTPAGVILGKEKGSRVWLKPGDTVTVSIDGIGTLVTPLV